MKIGNKEINVNGPIGDVEVVVVGIQADSGKVYDFIMDTEKSNSPELGAMVRVLSQEWTGRFIGIKLVPLKKAVHHVVSGILERSEEIDKIVEEIG